MGFGEAVRSGFDHYVRFDGRASRSAYWWWVLFAILVAVVGTGLDFALGTTIRNAEGQPTGGWITFVAGLALFLPGLSVTVRRLHDTDRSGWWVLINAIPLIGGIVLFIFMVTSGTPGVNRYGPPTA